MLPLRLTIPILFGLATTSCGEPPRSLSWEVTFGPGVDATSAVLVNTRILSGGCEAATELYVASVGPADPNGPTPGVLPPGRYGFEATALDAECVRIGYACEDLVLPRDDQQGVSLVLTDTSGDRACPPERCEAGRCFDVPRDGGSDVATDTPAPDALGDTGGDADAGAGGLIIAQGVPTASLAMVTLPSDAFLVSSGFVSSVQVGDASGWAMSRLGVGSDSAFTVTSRGAAVGAALRAGSTLLSPVGAGSASLRHEFDSVSYDLVGERWAWGAIARDQVVDSGGFAVAGSQILETVSTTRDVLAILHAHIRAASTGSSPSTLLQVDVDGAGCGRNIVRTPGVTPPLVGSSYFCLVSLAAGAHTFEVGSSVGSATIETLALQYVLIERGRVGLFGSTTSERVVPLTLPTPRRASRPIPPRLRGQLGVGGGRAPGRFDPLRRDPRWGLTAQLDRELRLAGRRGRRDPRGRRHRRR